MYESLLCVRGGNEIYVTYSKHIFYHKIIDELNLEIFQQK